MANIYVNHTGSSTPPYNTEAKATRNIQVALDAAVEGDKVLIKADQNYVMNGTDQQAAPFDVDHANGIIIKGYYSTPGDQDYDGTYYKDASHGWVVINANNGVFDVFVSGEDYDRLCWHNLKTINVYTDKTNYYFSSSYEGRHYGYLLQNCWITGGAVGVYCNALNSLVLRDCKFTGTYSGDGVISAIDNVTPGSITVEFCEFAHGSTPKSILVNCALSTIHDNIFNISGTVSIIIYALKGGLIFNNIIYEGSGGNIATGISLDTAETANCSAIYNNIIVGCTTSINEPVPIAFGGWNCFYNNGSNWTLRKGDIVKDPTFMNAPTGDFRLRPMSPCLNAGKPTLGGGYTDIGAWQRKSLLG